MITPTNEEISRLAYQLWQQGGHPDGRGDEFWFEAERQLQAGHATAHASPSDPINPERLKTEAAAESITDNYISPAPTQNEAIKAAIPTKGTPPVSPPPHKLTGTPKRGR
jgi:hypothetical protein